MKTIRDTKLGWRSIPIILSCPLWGGLFVIGALAGWASVYFLAGYLGAQEKMFKSRGEK